MILSTYLGQFGSRKAAFFLSCYSALSCVILYSIAQCLATPIPPEVIPKQVAFPSAKGYKWTYNLNGSLHRKIITRSIVGKKAVEIVISPVLDEIPFEEECEILEISSNGVCMPVAGGEKVDDPYWPLVFPLAKGKGWEWGHKSSVFGNNTCVGVENIKTPAGTFKCIHIESVVCSKNSREVHQYWYANNIGLVKCTYGKMTEVLVSHGMKW
ncbi:MAG: hypothetical protein LC104_06315 [Bacteroidales bacterium]|nr:hypothetical protein [Bacteroidales bacterium]